MVEGAGRRLPLERPELVSESINRVVDAILADRYAHDGQDSKGGSDLYAHNWEEVRAA